MASSYRFKLGSGKQPKDAFQISEVDAKVLGICIDNERKFFGHLNVILEGQGIQGATRRIRVGDRPAFLKSLEECETYSAVISLLQPLHPDPAKAAKEAYRRQDMAAAKKAWKLPHTGYEDVLDLLGKCLRDNASSWDPTHKYVPLAPIIQSSGWGKSRLVCELWRQDMYVLYISCLKRKSTGFPRRTPFLADLVEKAEADELSVVVLLGSIISVLNKSSKNCQEWINSQMENEEIASEIMSEYNNIMDNKVVNNLVIAPSGDLASYYKECTRVYGGFLAQHLDPLKEAQKFLLLCVDEAAELSSAEFVSFRMMLKYVPSRNCFFSVALGTDRTVADLAASYEDDPSSRVRLLSGTDELYDPIWLVGRSDVLVTTGDGEISQKQVLQYGRPLWAAYMRCVEADNQVTATIDLAKKKLLGKDVNLKKSDWVTRDVAVAVFACLIGLDVVAWGTLPQQLAARHMRTIVKISEDRKRVYTASAAEPALAAAAATLLHYKSDAYLCKFVSKLIEVCVDGLVLEGVRGEIVAKLVMLLAMHECTKSENYIKPVTLSEYLKTLFGEEILKKLRDNAVPLNSTVFFNCFLPTTMVPSNEQSLEYYKRGATSICRRNQHALDIILPCRSLRQEQEPSPNKRVREDSELGSSIVAQVKNLREHSSNKAKVEKVHEKLDTQEWVDHSMSILLQVGSKTNSVEVKADCVIAEGLDYGFIKNKKLRGLLGVLATTCEDIFRDSTDLERKVLQGLIPLGYIQHVDKEEEETLKKRQRKTLTTPLELPPDHEEPEAEDHDEAEPEEEDWWSED